WVHRVRKRRARNQARWLLTPDLSQPRRRKMNWHGAIGLWVLPVALLLSATGMTWSTYAGENVTKLRQELSWTTPAVTATLPGATGPAQPAGGDHHSAGTVAPAPADPTATIAQLDRVFAVAKAE